MSQATQDASAHRMQRLIDHAQVVLQRLSGDRSGVIDAASTLEGLLQWRTGARESGLGAKTREVADQLPEALARDLRYVAVVRNHVAHDALATPNDPWRFVDAARRCLTTLLDDRAWSRASTAAAGRRPATAQVIDVTARAVTPGAAGRGAPDDGVRRRTVKGRGVGGRGLILLALLVATLTIGLVFVQRSRHAAALDDEEAEPVSAVRSPPEPRRAAAPGARTTKPRAAAQADAAPDEDARAPAEPVRARPAGAAARPRIQPPADTSATDEAGLPDARRRPVDPGASDESADDAPQTENLRSLRSRL